MATTQTRDSNMSSATLSPSVSRTPTGALRMSVGKDQAALGLATGSNVHPLVHTFSVTQLSQAHNDFDALMAELENNPANSEELMVASAWVADTFYAEEGETLRTTRLRKGLS